MRVKLLSRVAAIILMLNATPAIANLDPPRTTGELYAACLPLEGKQSFTLSGEDLFNAGFCLASIHAKTMEHESLCMLEPDMFQVGQTLQAIKVLEAVEADGTITEFEQHLLDKARKKQKRVNPFLNSSASSHSTEAQVQAFINYARNNPQLWEESLLSGLDMAFSTSFPCGGTHGLMNK